MSDFLPGFRAYLAGRRRLRRTLDTYTTIATAFLTTLGDRPPTPTAVEIFLARPRRDGTARAAASRNQELAALRALAKFATRAGHWSVNPTEDIPFARKVRHDPAVLGAEELRALLRAAAAHPPAGEGPQVLAILGLLSQVGLRLHELVALNLDQVDLVTGTLLGIHGKGDTVHDLPLNRPSVALLTAWLRERTIRAPPGERALFLSRRRTRLAARTVESWMVTLRTAMGTAKPITPHTLRHTAATLALTMGTDLATVAELLRHANVNTTRLYLHLVDTRRREAVRRLAVTVPLEILPTVVSPGLTDTLSADPASQPAPVPPEPLVSPCDENTCDQYRLVADSTPQFTVSNPPTNTTHSRPGVRSVSEPHGGVERERPLGGREEGERMMRVGIWMGFMLGVVAAGCGSSAPSSTGDTGPSSDLGLAADALDVTVPTDTGGGPDTLVTLDVTPADSSLTPDVTDATPTLDGGGVGPDVGMDAASDTTGLDAPTDQSVPSDTAPACGSCPAPAHAAPVCDAGVCGFTCLAGYGDCDGDPATGCETDLLHTVSACGSCTTACTAPNATSVCLGGHCGLGPCMTGYGDCDGLVANGCEASLTTDTHCGACTSACAIGTHCAAGLCVRTCDPGFTACPTACADLQVDPLNCGACGHACPAGPNATATCTAGVCGLTCTTGYADCDGLTTNGCEAQPATDPTNCGTCGHRCAAPTGGTATCALGTCGESCPTGAHLCGTACLSTTSVSACGASCSPCPVPAHGSATCDGTTCRFTCATGYVVAGAVCLPLPPRPLAPLSTATVTSRRPTLRWSLVAPGLSTRVTLCRDRALTMGCLTVTVPGSVTDPGTTLDPGVWFWQVRGSTGTAVGPSNDLVWQFTVGVRSAATDTSWGTTPDLNGDGYADLVVGSEYSAPVQIFQGGPSAIDTTPTTTLTPPARAGYFGGALASAGDVNGDGYADLVAGAQGYPGRAYVYFGGPSGLMDPPDQTLTGPTGSSIYGSAVASAGDVNGDGYADVVVGAYNSNTVYVYRGGPTGLDPTPTTLTGTTAGSSFGYAVAGLDVNADGYGDVAIGAYTGPSPSVSVFLGGAFGLGTTPVVLTGARDSSFGGALANAGDVNGDGYGDLIVGARGANTAYLFEGSRTGLHASPDTVLTRSEFTFGVGVGGGFDVNGDGYADVVVGASIAQRADLFLGGPTGIATTPATTVSGPANFGHAVAGLGDLNGDGYGDLAVGAPSLTSAGQTFVYLGGPTGIMTTLPTLVGPADGTGFGWSVATRIPTPPALRALHLRPTLPRRGLNGRDRG